MLKIGIISDTHDDIENTKRAIELFNNLGVNHVFHAGDYIFPGMLRLFKALNSKVNLYGVRGNNDGELLGIVNVFKEIENAVFFNEFGRVVIDSTEIGIYHGTNSELSDTLIQSQIFDLLILGHTHVRRIDKIGKTLVLNPGTLNKNFFPKEEQEIPSIIIYEREGESEGNGSARFVSLGRD